MGNTVAASTLALGGLRDIAIGRKDRSGRRGMLLQHGRPGRPLGPWLDQTGDGMAPRPEGLAVALDAIASSIFRAGHVVRFQQHHCDDVRRERVRMLDGTIEQQACRGAASERAVNADAILYSDSRMPQKAPIATHLSHLSRSPSNRCMCADVYSLR